MKIAFTSFAAARYLDTFLGSSWNRSKVSLARSTSCCCSVASPALAGERQTSPRPMQPHTASATLRHLNDRLDADPLGRRLSFVISHFSLEACPAHVTRRPGSILRGIILLS
jgi:hypothetical protein